MGDQRQIPEVDVDGQIRPTLRYLESGRETFEELVPKRRDDLVDALWAMTARELRAIVFALVVDEQAGQAVSTSPEGPDEPPIAFGR